MWRSSLPALTIMRPTCIAPTTSIGAVGTIAIVAIMSRIDSA